MIVFILGAMGFLAVLGFGCWLTGEAVESGRFGRSSFAAFGYWSVVLGSVFWLIVEADKADKAKGPCLQYETRMMFNAATKTMMPAKFCSLRGEWVDQPK